MRRLREHQLALTAVAFALAAGAVAGIAAAWGFGGFWQVWGHVHPGWLVLVAGAELLTVPAYALAYRAVASIHGGPALAKPFLMRVVAAGFGPFAPAGGFAIDRRVLSTICEDDVATIRVLGLGALEWALLAPATCICAIVLLAAGGDGVMPSVLWPWALAVPVGLAVALWLAAPGRRERIASGGGQIRRHFGTGLEGIAVLVSLARGPSRRIAAWAGAAAYWALDIAAFYGAVRFAGLSPDIGAVVIAYGTGYALTRRSTPLGGAGVTEVLMTFALHWAGQPVLPALTAVVVYRVFNFVVPTLPALLSHARVKPLLDAADEGRSPTASERRQATAPLPLARR